MESPQLHPGAHLPPHQPDAMSSMAMSFAAMQMQPDPMNRFRGPPPPPAAMSHAMLSSGAKMQAVHPDASGYYPGARPDAFYPTSQPPVPQPLQHHLYAPPLAHISALHPHQRSIHSFFMSDKLREELQERSEATLRTIPGVYI